MRAAQPNAAHWLIAAALRLRASRGLTSSIVTQNVDRLHQAAGVPAEAILELHGTIHEVGCLDCGWRAPRSDVQEALEAANAAWLRE